MSYQFAMSLINGPNSHQATFAIISFRDTIPVKTTFLTRDQFLAQIMGIETSPANPTDTNLLDQWQIDYCWFYTDSNTTRRHYEYDCPLIDEIWKVRYRRDPYNANMRRDDGWAHNYYGPSQPQLRFLREKYNVRNISDFFVGDHLFHFLKDIQDTSWIRQYRTAS